MDGAFFSVLAIIKVRKDKLVLFICQLVVSPRCLAAGWLFEYSGARLMTKFVGLIPAHNDSLIGESSLVTIVDLYGL